MSFNDRSGVETQTRGNARKTPHGIADMWLGFGGDSRSSARPPVSLSSNKAGTRPLGTVGFDDLAQWVAAEQTGQLFNDRCGVDSDTPLSLRAGKGWLSCCVVHSGKKPSRVRLVWTQTPAKAPKSASFLGESPLRNDVKYRKTPEPVQFRPSVSIFNGQAVECTALAVTVANLRGSGRENMLPAGSVGQPSLCMTAASRFTGNPPRWAQACAAALSLSGGTD